MNRVGPILGKCALARIVLLLGFAAGAHAAHLVYQKNISATLMATDAAGNLYFTGPSTINKLDSNGNVIYSTTHSIPGDIGGFAVDRTGAVILVGTTLSDTLPTTPGVFQPQRSPGVCIAGDRSAQRYPCQDVFIVKFAPDGGLAWASYLGGLGNDQANAVATDSAGNIYVTGFTLSADFPVTGPFQSAFGGYADAFVSKISADGTRLLYSSTLGGSGYDVGQSIAVDATGSAYVGGSLGTALPNLAAPGFARSCSGPDADLSAMLVKVNPAGDRLDFAGCIAPQTLANITAITIDSRGDVYYAGNAIHDVATTPGAYHSSLPAIYTTFVQKIAPDGSALKYSAAFPGYSFGPVSIAVDATGALYVSGAVEDQQFPIAGPAIQPCPSSSGFFNQVLLKLNPAGSEPTYSSFDQGSRLALAPDGSVYIGGALLRKLAALDVPGDSFLTTSCVLNAANFAMVTDYGQSGISPGEIVTLKGSGLGPLTPPDLGLVDGKLPTSMGGTQVLFDGVPAPLIYAQDGQINLVAPYAVANRTSTSIEVCYKGQATAPVTIPVSPTSANLFLNADGQPRIFNADYSVNSQANAVARGGMLILYLTGGGQTNPASIDGQIWQTTGGLAAPVSAELQNYGNADSVRTSVPVLYAGPVPGQTSGLQQINIGIPTELGDSFVTQQFSVGSLVLVKIGTQQISAAVYVK
jgi:uncharacterized protein (TIGR03437 family)